MCVCVCPKRPFDVSSVTRRFNMPLSSEMFELRNGSTVWHLHSDEERCRMHRHSSPRCYTQCTQYTHTSTAQEGVRSASDERQCVGRERRLQSGRNLRLILI